jgi:hypothetical protein
MPAVPKNEGPLETTKLQSKELKEATVTALKKTAQKELQKCNQK